jgi:hypothetical protein
MKLSTAFKYLGEYYVTSLAVGLVVALAVILSSRKGAQ